MRFVDGHRLQEESRVESRECEEWIIRRAEVAGELIHNQGVD